MGFSRRKFLIGSSAVAGGLVVGCSLLPGRDTTAAYSATAKNGEVALNAWIKIDPTGVVTVAVPRAEMGQGIFTSLSQLIAEELEVDWGSIRAEQAPVDEIYVNSYMLKEGLSFTDGFHRGENTLGAKVMAKIAGILGIQATGGSTSIRDAWEPMRLAGAAGREMLITAAANKWGFPVSQCRAEKGHVIHVPSKQTLGYGELVGLAASLDVPSDPKLKPASEFKVIGKSMKRLDTAQKVNGQAVFGIDVEPEGLLYAAIKTSPVFGGSVKSYDQKAVLGMPGVKAVVPYPAGVAVVADSWWRAKKAIDSLPIEFDDGGNGGLNTDSIFKQFAQELETGDANTYMDVGEAEEFLVKQSDVLEATYKAPYLAHACMEPINCTAKVKDGKVEVWVANQAPTLVKWFAAKAADIDSENVTVHSPFLGGGFGRRIEVDMVIQAVTIAKALPGTPIKMIWTREEDFQHDMYRPAALSRFKGTLDEKGNVAAWHNRIVSQAPTFSVMTRFAPAMAMDMSDNTTAQGSADTPYAFPHKHIEHVPVDLPVPVGFWRSVGHSYNAFFSESFMDEMAHKAKKDAYQFRRALLADRKDARDVLDLLVKEAEWDKPLGAGRAKGMALHESFGSIVGQVVEITLSDDKQLSVDRVVSVVDCGVVVNPDTVVAQIESGLIYGLTAAFYGEINIENGQVTQSNFSDYQMIRLSNAPVMETHLAPSGRHLGGVGEIATPPIAPAVTNAIFAAKGERIRELPLIKSGYEVG
ncbi:MAG: molybdopterin-dependent oxidoreductase [Alphaproteobacteria bacterium]|nr:molybdopterin-dependent oxidoreductase [Alphaproteobacteria bacterium]